MDLHDYVLYKFQANQFDGLSVKEPGSAEIFTRNYPWNSQKGKLSHNDCATALPTQIVRISASSRKNSRKFFFPLENAFAKKAEKKPTVCKI